MSEMPRKHTFLCGLQKLTARFLCHEQTSKFHSSCPTKQVTSSRTDPVYEQSIGSRCHNPVYAQFDDVSCKYDDVGKAVEPVYSSVPSVDIGKGCSRWSEGLEDPRDRVTHNHPNTPARAGTHRRRPIKDKGHEPGSKVNCALTEHTRCRYVNRHHWSEKTSELKAVDIDGRNLYSSDSGFTDEPQSTLRPLETVSEDGAQRHKEWKAMEALTITITQPCKGLGLTIRGTCPPRVGRVNTGRAAASAGLRPGDCLVKINGRCVLRSDAGSVAKLIQESGGHECLSFDIVRYGTQSQNPVESSQEHVSDGNVLDGYNCLETRLQRHKKKRKHSKAEAMGGLGNETSVTTTETVSAERRSSASKENLVGIGCRTLPRKKTKRFKAPDDKVIRPEPTVSRAHMSSGSYYKWDPEISNIRFEEPGSRSDSRMDSQMSGQSTYLELNTARIESVEHSDTSVGLQLQPSCVNADQQREDGEQDILSSHKSNEITESVMDYNNNFIDFPLDRIPQIGLINGNNGISGVIQSVLELEKEFVQHMTNGIQMFTRPLRNALLSPKQHRTLFQNIEKLVALSELSISQLPKAGDCLRGASILGAVYQKRIHLRCEMYRTYARGLPDAINLLHHLLKENKEFLQYMSSCQGCDLRDFLERPIIHVQRMTNVFSEACQEKSLPENQPDCHDLLEALQGLQDLSKVMMDSGLRYITGLPKSL